MSATLLKNGTWGQCAAHKHGIRAGIENNGNVICKILHKEKAGLAKIGDKDAGMARRSGCLDGDQGFLERR